MEPKPKEDTPPKRVYYPKEAAQLARISLSAFYDGCRRNEIPHIRVGAKILIPVVAFNKWLNGETIQKVAER